MGESNRGKDRNTDLRETHRVRGVQREREREGERESDGERRLEFNRKMFERNRNRDRVEKRREKQND